jgi:hypothetical protein
MRAAEVRPSDCPGVTGPNAQRCPAPGRWRSPGGTARGRPGRMPIVPRSHRGPSAISWSSSVTSSCSSPVSSPAASTLRPSSRQVPVLAREDHRQGGAPAAERGRTTLTVSFRGDRIVRRGRTARRLWQAQSTVMREGGPPGGGCGGRRCGGGPRRASPTLRQRAWAAAHQRRDSPRPQPPTAGPMEINKRPTS